MYAHRKAADDHVKLAALVGQGTGRAAPLAADVTDDRLAIRIPNAPGRAGGLLGQTLGQTLGPTSVNPL